MRHDPDGKDAHNPLEPRLQAQRQLRQNAIAIDRHNHVPHKQTPPPLHGRGGKAS
ncbi:hypothetical protein [Silvimonas iriomotensis]|uniref:Uncharacterized protein n=1 Tax=Silvimonas iriomotensis TaxID=449662 RepID=A0ABQ2PBN0_9NEIS|nr:hypothetical protein [Silvimonas iriomotensis]GGP22660.1 hypothetical protein GCM10010970_26600 [Silvimonas iriomotensis]